jgi:hypothetical protein
MRLSCMGLSCMCLSVRWSGAAGWSGGLLVAALLFFGASSNASGSRSVSGSAERSVSVTNLEPLPAGVTLPVRLGRSLHAGRTRVGAAVMVKTTQRVPVTGGIYLDRGAELKGKVVASVAGDGTAGSPSVLSIEFTSLRYRKQTVGLQIKAIAIANFVQVGDTFLPVQGGSDRGNSSEASWTTTQVGGDQVVRSGWVGPVVGSGLRTVGRADYYGVYTLPAGPEASSAPRAMGVFSTTASGLYGLESGTSLSSSGGTITLSRAGKRLEMRDGDNLLLEVVSSSR